MKRYQMFAGEYFYFSFTFYGSESKVDLPCEDLKN